MKTAPLAKEQERRLAWQDMPQTEKMSLFTQLFGKHGVDMVQFCETQQKLHKTVDILTKHLQT